MSSSEPMRVVVVDDDRPMLRTHRRVLRAHGFDPILMADPIEAFADILARPPAVVIVDLAMPVMSGLELASRVRTALHPCAPSLVLVSSSIGDLTAREAAIFDVIHPKPYSIDRFVRDINRAARAYAERAAASSEVIATPAAALFRQESEEQEK